PGASPFGPLNVPSTFNFGWPRASETPASKISTKKIVCRRSWGERIFSLFPMRARSACERERSPPSILIMLHTRSLVRYIWSLSYFNSSACVATICGQARRDDESYLNRYGEEEQRRLVANGDDRKGCDQTG